MKTSKQDIVFYGFRLYKFQLEFMHRKSKYTTAFRIFTLSVYLFTFVLTAINLGISRGKAFFKTLESFITVFHVSSFSKCAACFKKLKITLVNNLKHWNVSTRFFQNTLFNIQQKVKCDHISMRRQISLQQLWLCRWNFILHLPIVNIK